MRFFRHALLSALMMVSATSAAAQDFGRAAGGRLIGIYDDQGTPLEGVEIHDLISKSRILTSSTVQRMCEE